MSTARIITLVASGALALAVASRVEAQSMPPALTQFLRQTIGLQPDEIAAANSGKAVVKSLESPDHNELAVFAIISIGVPRSFYVRRASDFRTSLRNPFRLRFAIFSDPALPSDVATLSVPHKDVQDFANCRAGSCKTKMSAEAMAQVRSRIDSAPAAADSVASAYFRARMIEYVTGYRARGNAALVTYADQDSVTAAGRVFEAMVSRSPYLYEYAPSLERYLRNYPKDRPADVSEALFWAEDDLPNLRPTITLTHVVVAATPELACCTLIAAKQLYADHYLDGAVDVTAVVDQMGSSPGIYLVFLRRLHFDRLPSGGLMDVRGKAVGKLRDQTRTSMSEEKAGSEQAYTSATAR